MRAENGAQPFLLTAERGVLFVAVCCRNDDLNACVPGQSVHLMIPWTAHRLPCQLVVAIRVSGETPVSYVLLMQN